jgi:hypothetical protein
MSTVLKTRCAYQILRTTSSGPRHLKIPALISTSSRDWPARSSSVGLVASTTAAVALLSGTRAALLGNRRFIWVPFVKSLADHSSLRRCLVLSKICRRSLPCNALRTNGLIRSVRNPCGNRLSSAQSLCGAPVSIGPVNRSDRARRPGCRGSLFPSHPSCTSTRPAIPRSFLNQRPFACERGSANVRARSRRQA